MVDLGNPNQYLEQPIMQVETSDRKCQDYVGHVS